MKPMKKDLLLGLLESYSFMTGRFTLASGRESDYYFDFRASASDPEAIKLVGELFFEELSSMDPKPDAVGGAIFGAAPIVTSIAIESYLQKAPMPGFYVRKEPKKYGTMSFIEGTVDPARHRNIVMVEDVITTGGSILRAVERVREAFPECNILRIMGVLDRMEGGRGNIEKAGYELWTLFTIRDLFDAHNRKKGQ